ncbi:MAG: PRC-barrel domain-containing protein, partial [Acetobacteraceae bacterium]
TVSLLAAPGLAMANTTPVGSNGASTTSAPGTISPKAGTLKGGPSGAGTVGTATATQAKPADQQTATATPATPPAQQTETDTSALASSGGYTGSQILIQKDKAQAQKDAKNGDHDTSGTPSKLNPLLADNGDARAGKVIGTDVYNAQDKKIGNVDDILVGKNGTFAVISTKGDKKVAVPFDKLQFGDNKVNGDEKVVMPDTTKAELSQKTEVHYKMANNNNAGHARAGNTHAMAGSGIGAPPASGAIGGNHKG